MANCENLEKILKLWILPISKKFVYVLDSYNIYKSNTYSRSSLNLTLNLKIKNKKTYEFVIFINQFSRLNNVSMLLKEGSILFIFHFTNMVYSRQQQQQQQLQTLNDKCDRLLNDVKILKQRTRM